MQPRSATPTNTTRAGVQFSYIGEDAGLVVANRTDKEGRFFNSTTNDIHTLFGRILVRRRSFYSLRSVYVMLLSSYSK